MDEIADDPFPAKAPADEAGGEWNQLTQAVGDWATSRAPQALWRQLQSPLKALAALGALLFVLRVCGALVDAVNSFPLLPGLLELVGIIWLTRTGLPKLLHREKRQEFLAQLQQTWGTLSNRD